jgi:hypothetical protein
MIKVGAEIECEYNKRLLGTIKTSGYHCKKTFGCSGWTSEGDGSLSTRKWKEDGDTVEFVSKVTSIDQFKTYLATFKEFISHNGEYELNKVLNFNETTGAHLHFSAGKTKFWGRVPYKKFVETRNMFFEKLEASSIKSKQVIKEAYFRGYASELTEDNYNKIRDEPERGYQSRRGEFNFKCESEENHTELDGTKNITGRGIEWRSLNMRGIQTWAELFEFYDIVFECVEFLVKTGFDYSENKEQECIIEPETDRSIEQAMTVGRFRKKVTNNIITQSPEMMNVLLSPWGSQIVVGEDSMDTSEDIIIDDLDSSSDDLGIIEEEL